METQKGEEVLATEHQREAGPSQLRLLQETLVLNEANSKETKTTDPAWGNNLMHLFDCDLLFSCRSLTLYVCNDHDSLYVGEETITESINGFKVLTKEKQRLFPHSLEKQSYFHW